MERVERLVRPSREAGHGHRHCNIGLDDFAVLVQERDIDAAGIDDFVRDDRCDRILVVACGGDVQLGTLGQRAFGSFDAHVYTVCRVVKRLLGVLFLLLLISVLVLVRIGCGGRLARIGRSRTRRTGLVGSTCRCCVIRRRIIRCRGAVTTQIVSSRRCGRIACTAFGHGGSIG